MHRTRGLAAPRFRAGEPRTRREPDRDMQFPSAVLLVTELHARHPPRVRQLQGGGEQRRGIHTPKLPDQHHHPPDPLTHTKQRKAVLVYYFELAFLSIMEDHMMAVQCKLILADKRNNTNERNYD